MTEKTYSLLDLKNYCSLTVAKCAVLAEAACVCLEKNDHQPGVTIQVEGSYKGNFSVRWQPLDPTVFESWENSEEAVEMAAYAFAILCIFELSPYHIVRQSMKGTGFDYWLGDKTSENPKREVGNLEVSGIMRGSKGRINFRVKEKLLQVKSAGGPGTATIIIVAEMSRPLAKMIQP